MRAMILAGGLSTRLYPLTKALPKPLVPVGGEPNAAHVIRYLHSYGVNEIAINVHYLADAITGALGDGSQYGVRLEYLHETELLGSAGAVKQMERFFAREPFVVVGCDDLTDLPLDQLVQFHRERSAIATIGLVQRDVVEQYGVVVTNADGRITGFQEKPARGTERSKLVNTGIYAFTAEIFAHIPAGCFYDFGKDVFPSLQQQDAAFYGFDARGAYWCDIGTPDEYRRATNDLLRGAFHIPEVKGGIDPSAKIEGPTMMAGDVWIGAGAEITGATVIGPSVIGAGVRIDAGAVVERSILWAQAHVGERATVRDAIVGIGYHVAPGTHLERAIVADDARSSFDYGLRPAQDDKKVEALSETKAEELSR